MPNLYGDILSDVAAQITGSVGLKGSANIGKKFAMFEAILGSAPLIAGQNVANPSGLIQGAILMLNHIGQSEAAEKIQNAWLKTIEDGYHTFDMFEEKTSIQKLGTREFSEKVIENLGSKPSYLQHVSYKSLSLNIPKYIRKPQRHKVLLGVDLFVHWNGSEPNELAVKLNSLCSNEIKLIMITNSGIKVWPDGLSETFCTDHWRCRFMTTEGTKLDNKSIPLFYK